MSNSNLEDFTKRLEHMMLFQITTNLKSGKITVEEAQKISREYLALTPNSEEELLQAVINMGHHYPVLEPVIATFSTEYDEAFKNNVLSQMHEKINNNDIDSAVKLGKTEGPVHV